MRECAQRERERERETHTVVVEKSNQILRSKRLFAQLQQYQRRRMEILSNTRWGEGARWRGDGMEREKAAAGATDLDLIDSRSDLTVRFDLHERLAGEI